MKSVRTTTPNFHLYQRVSTDKAALLFSTNHRLPRREAGRTAETPQSSVRNRVTQRPGGQEAETWQVADAITRPRAQEQAAGRQACLGRV